MSIPFILVLVGGLSLIIFLTVVKQRATTELHHKLHPPKKQQEEFLKACELYLEYRKDPETHPGPAKDAKRDAAKDILEQGHLPAALVHLEFPKNPHARLLLMTQDGEPAHFTYRAIETASQETFLTCRQQDQNLTGCMQDKQFWNGDTFSAEAWSHYCGDMEHAYNQMVERYLNELPPEFSSEIGPKTV